jgi:hypothetical protein
MRVQLVHHLRSHVGDFLHRTGQRMIEFWIEPLNFGPCAALVSLAALAGLLRAKFANREWAAFACVLALYPVLYYFTFTFSRFRYPVEPLIFVLAGYAISELIAYGRGRIASSETT